jgi:hypothetical protein
VWYSCEFISSNSIRKADPVLQSHDPALIDAVVTQLSLIRKAGVPLTVVLMRGIILGHIRHRCPKILTAKLKKDGTPFECSESYVRSFVQEHLNWTPQVATRAAQKIPVDAKQQCRRTFLRMVHAVLTCGIQHAGLCMNFDQTQIVVQDNRAKTFAKKGSKQVPVVGKEEKRAWTCVVGVVNNGDLLPFQIIVQGATSAVHPQASAPSTSEARATGHDWDHNPKTYWSNQTTMRHYVMYFIVLYFTRKKEELGYLLDQVCIVLLDVWSVHQSLEFRRWICATYPWLWLIYVPGGLTLLFQPCDVGVQRWLKHALRRFQLEDIVEETTTFLDNGGDPLKMKLETRIGVLRNRLVRWFVETHKAINKPQLVLNAWKNCIVGEFNLSFNSVSSIEAARLYATLKQTDPELWEELNCDSDLKNSSDDVHPAVPEDNSECPFDDADADVDDNTDDSARDALAAPALPHSPQPRHEDPAKAERLNALPDIFDFDNVNLSKCAT